MRLHDFLKQRGLTAEQFGGLVGASARAVGKWRRGERIPRAQAMARIVKATEGAVGPADFFSSPAPPSTPPPDNQPDS